MMKVSRGQGLMVMSTAAVLAVTMAGCSGTTSSTSASTASSSSATSSASSAVPSSSAAAASGNYTSLLITASDIIAPGDTFTAQAPMPNPNGMNGVATAFADQSDTREIGATILVLPNASAANTALVGSISALGQLVVGAEPQSAAVGSSGLLATGNSPDGSKAVTVLLFTEGTAFVTLEFDSKPGDPVPLEFVTDVGQKQDTALKAGLPM